MNSSTQFFNDSGSISPVKHCYLPSSPSLMEDDLHLTSSHKMTAPSITRRIRTVSTDLSMDEFATPPKQCRWVVGASYDYNEYDELSNSNSCCSSAMEPNTPAPRSHLSLTTNAAGSGFSIRMKPFRAGMNHFEDETTYGSVFDLENDDELENMLFSNSCRRDEVFAEDSMGYGISSSLSFDDDQEEDGDISFNNNSIGMITPPLTPQNQKMCLAPDLDAAPPRIKNAPSFRSAMDFHSETSSHCKLPYLGGF